MSRFNRLLHGGMQYIVGFGAGGVFAAMVFPETFLLSSYKKFFQLYNKGFEVKVDKYTSQLGQEVLDEIKLKVEEEARVNFFVAYGQELVTKGSLHTHQGAIVGLPANFKYRSLENVERQKVILNNKNVNWDSKGGEMLAKSMVLSDNAKKFAMARGIYSVKSYRLFFDAGIMSLTALMTYVAGFNLSRVMGLKARFPTPMRGVFYTGVASLGYFFYTIMSDAYNCRQDRKLDQKAGRLSSEIAVGGVEYYTKLLQRNIALRELLDGSGSKLYTMYGNETQSWRTPKLALTLHRDLLVSIVNEYNSTNKDGQNDSSESL